MAFLIAVAALPIVALLLAMAARIEHLIDGESRNPAALSPDGQR